MLPVFVRGKLFFQNKAVAYPLIIGVITAILMLVINSIVGFIPVGEGYGWDGTQYYDQVEHLAAGHPIRNDPYRLVRLGSFIPAIFASLSHMSRPHILIFQFYVNVLLLAASAGFFFDFLRRMQPSLKTAFLSTAVLVFCWPFLILPGYYPFLTDHMALVLSCVSLWVWQRQIRFILPLFCAWSFFVLPGSFIVPFVLLAMPYTPLHESSGKEDRLLSKYAFWGISMSVGLAIVIFLAHLLSAFSDQAILDSPGGAPIAQPELRLSAEALSCIFIFAVSLVWIGMLNSRQMWLSIRPRLLGLGVVIVLISAAVIKKIFDWNEGFAGPDIVSNILLQSLADPGKPLVSHFLYFGPVIFLACAAIPLKFYKHDFSIPWPLLALFIEFLPILVLGSESRQWIEIFPVAIALFAFSNYSIKIQKLVLFFSVSLCVPAFWLKSAVHRAYAQKMSFDSYEYQTYFGRQGPWISPFVYHLALVGLGIFAVIAMIIVLYDRRMKNRLINADQCIIEKKP